jgi:hypothetical protein
MLAPLVLFFQGWLSLYWYIYEESGIDCLNSDLYRENKKDFRINSNNYCRYVIPGYTCG